MAKKTVRAALKGGKPPVGKRETRTRKLKNSPDTRGPTVNAWTKTVTHPPKSCR